MVSCSCSILIPTVGRSQWLLRLLEAVLAQAPADAEVIAVDQSGDVEHARISAWVQARGDARLHLLRAPPVGLPAARNVGLQEAHGEVILFFDDDTELHPGCVAAHLANYRDPRVGGVAGRIEEHRLRPNIGKTANYLDFGGRVRTNLAGRARAPIATVKGANMSFRRAAILQVGAFDPGFRGTAFLEDADFSTRIAAAGWKLCFDPAASLTHFSAPSGGVRTGSAARTEAWRFHNTGRFVRKHRNYAHLAATALLFSAIALKRAAQWREPGAAPWLLAALMRGYRDAKAPVQT